MAIATTPHLRPLGLGQILDQAVRLYRRNFFKFIGIVTAVIARSIAGDYLGESSGIIEAYANIGSNWGQLIITFVLLFFLTIGLIIGFVVVVCVGWIVGPGVLAFLGLVLTPLIAPAIVLEKDTDVLLGIRRAWDLARRRFWWVLGFAFILTLFGQLIVTGPTLLVSFLFQVLIGNPLETGLFNVFAWQTVTQTLVGLVSGLIYLPLHLTGMVLLYFDLRIHTEGLDLALLTKTTPDSQATIEDITTQAPPAEQGNLITMAEVGYFCLITLGAVVIMAILVMIGMVYGFALVAAGGAGF